MTSTLAPLTLVSCPDARALTQLALDAVGQNFDEYVAFPSTEARDAVVLWVLHTHVFRSFASTPRLSIRSTDPASGKSRVLDVIEGMVPKPRNMIDTSASVLWRLIENGSPTLLLDEADTVFGKAGSNSTKRQLRAIINAGHRDGSIVPRCIGTDEVKDFHVFAPVAVAGLGRLPETIATRSVEIVMRPRREGDREITPFRRRHAEHSLKRAYRLCELWAADAAESLATSMPDLPVEDRAADVWEPLVAIADLAGEVWGERARTACKALVDDAARDSQDSEVLPGSPRLAPRSQAALAFVNSRPATSAPEAARHLGISDDMAGQYLRRLANSRLIAQPERGRFAPLLSEVSEAD